MSAKIDQYINEMLFGGRVIETGVEWMPFVICRGLAGHEKVIADHKYELAFREAISMGLESEQDILKRSYDIGTWSIHSDALLEEIERQIKAIKIELPSLKFRVAIKNGKIKKLEEHEKKLREIRSRKESLVGTSAERHALEQKTWWVIYQSYFTLGMEKLWNTYDDFCESDIDDINKFVVAYLSQFHIVEADLRKIARNPLWRVYYTTCGASATDLFGKRMCDLDQNQLNLLYWSSIYDNALNSLESPDKDTFDDDTAFDAWMDMQEKKYAEQKKERDLEKIGGKSSGAKKGNSNLYEQFIVTDKAGANELYKGLNNEQRPSVAARKQAGTRKPNK